MPEDTRYSSWARLLAILRAINEVPLYSYQLAVKTGVAESTLRRDIAWLEKNWPGVKSIRVGHKKLYSYTHAPLGVDHD